MDNGTKNLVLGWLDGNHAPACIDQTARWMRDALRLGPLNACRRLIREALGETPADTVAPAAINGMLSIGGRRWKCACGAEIVADCECCEPPRHCLSGGSDA